MRAVYHLAFIFFITGCFNSGNEEVECARIIDREQRSECVYNKSLSTVNAAFCKEISDNKMSKKCIDDIALKLGNEYSCYQHTKLSDRENCERLVVEQVKKSKN